MYSLGTAKSTEGSQPLSRRTSRLFMLGMILISALAVSVGHTAAAAANEVWSGIKQTHFGGRPIKSGAGVIGLGAPYRAEDPAIVPITIKDLLPANSERRIRKVWLVIDHNPIPMSAVFNFAPLAARADIATRVRVNAYTTMRVIAETDDGQLYMATRYVKASGGCSAPATKDPAAALTQLGEIKLRTYDQTGSAGESKDILLMIRHPNNTGLQMNPLTRLYTPAHYVKHVSIDYAGSPVLTINSTFSFSENPSLRFHFQPQKPGKLTARVVDNRDMHFAQALRLRSPSDQVASQAE